MAVLSKDPVKDLCIWSMKLVLVREIIRTNTNTLECLYFQNSNVLSAILCLIKEIDGPSLEVVEMAVRCRMEELEDWEPRSLVGHVHWTLSKHSIEWKNPISLDRNVHIDDNSCMLTLWLSLSGPPKDRPACEILENLICVWISPSSGYFLGLLCS